MDYDLRSKTALVTGGSSGIGRACARLLAAEGAGVVVGDVNDVGAKETVDELGAAGGTAVAVHMDVTDPEQVAGAVAFAVSEFGSLDCAVNCAAITLTGERVPTAEVAVETFDRITAVDLRGTFLSLKYELLQMLEQGSGSIVNVSSVSGLKSGQLNPSYVAAKHGVIGLTRAAAVEYAGRGIRVNVLCPGITDTPMIASISGQYVPDSTIPLGRVARPEEIAHAAVWLCSPVSSYATGSVVVVDGGKFA